MRKQKFVSKHQHPVGLRSGDEGFKKKERHPLFICSPSEEPKVNYSYNEQIKADKWNKVTLAGPLCFLLLPHTNGHAVTLARKTIRDRIKFIQHHAGLALGIATKAKREP